MKRHTARTHIVIASLLTLLLVALTAIPATAATVKRSPDNERYAHKLVNCLRTGGKVTSTGKCKGYGTGKYSKYVKPLKRSIRISNRVSGPWAKRSVQFNGRRTCWIGHSKAGSTVDKRFRAASLSNVVNGENMGCYLTYPKKAVIKIVLMWQREKAWRGSHWRQIKSWGFKSAGYGVARYGKRKVQLVVNFYGKVVE